MPPKGTRSSTGSWEWWQMGGKAGTGGHIHRFEGSFLAFIPSLVAWHQLGLHKRGTSLKSCIISTSKLFLSPPSSKPPSSKACTSTKGSEQLSWYHGYFIIKHQLTVTTMCVLLAGGREVVWALSPLFLSRPSLVQLFAASKAQTSGAWSHPRTLYDGW